MMSGANYVIYGCSSARIIPGVSLYRSLTLEEKYCYSYYSINQSINQSINVFEGKTQTVQLTNIYKHILFLLMIILMIIAIMKTVEPFE